MGCGAPPSLFLPSPVPSPGVFRWKVGSVTMEVGRGQSSKALEEARRLDAVAYGMMVRFRQAESPLGAEENPREFLLTRVLASFDF